MPVPVPRLSKPVAHPVIKQNQCGDRQITPSIFQHLTCSLPVSPTGPPPSFGTREQWINSLPSWRRAKPRRVWEDDSRFVEQSQEQHFRQGLTAADNASVIKGTRAQACIPPLVINISGPPTEMPANLPQGFNGEAGDGMSSDYSIIGKVHHSEGRWAPGSSTVDDANGMDVEQSQLGAEGASPVWGQENATIDDDQLYERGAFTPVFEDASPGTTSGNDVASSPIEPVTPFGEFVDRAVAATQPYPVYDMYSAANLVPQDSQYAFQDKHCGAQCYQTQPAYPLIVEQPKEPAPAPVPELVVTPSATPGYKKLAEPLSDWVSNYVWKVCTTGLSLPSMFSRPMSPAVNQYTSSPPSYLASSVHSLLLSTLLQPSAVFLAIWYIVRLPVFFGATGLGADHVKELRFRVALLGDSRGGLDREAMEASAPFRLIVLGCMLANKWLDDHTFSNKTWHTISNVPILALNELESLSLDIFSYDLSVSPREWSQWLSHVMLYHLSLSSPSHPQPISRPSANPHSIVRKAIDEITQAPAACNPNASQQQPVFLGLEERRKEKLEKEKALAVDILEIDLDEDGPLREEYLPKRRVSGAGSSRSSKEVLPAPRVPADEPKGWERCHIIEMEKPLPPPAKWSPAGDEPILRERNRVSGHYVAVQPPLVTSIAPFHVLPPYHQPHELGYPSQNWAPAGGYVAIKPPGYVYDAPSLHPALPTYTQYPFVLPIAVPHSRSQSLSYDQDNSRNHLRSYSQSRFEYRCSDIRMTANELAPPTQIDNQWATATGQYAYPAQAFAPHSSVNYQSTWLRT